MKLLILLYNNEPKLLNYFPKNLENLYKEIKNCFKFSKNNKKINLISKSFFLNNKNENFDEKKINSEEDYIYLTDLTKADLIFIIIDNEDSINNLKDKIEELKIDKENLRKLYEKLEFENKNFLFNIKEKEKEIEKLKKQNKVLNIDKSNILYQLNKNNNNIIDNINKINNELILNYNCEFLKNDVLNFSISEIQDKKIKEYSIKIIDSGIRKFPNDTILKCVPEDNNSFFYHVKYNNDDVWIYKEDNKRIVVFPIKILFKNYKKCKIGDINNLNYFLISDREGKIGNKNKIGSLIVNITK